MAEYIEREAAFNEIFKLPPKVDDDGYCWVTRSAVAGSIDSIPAADVAEVRYGRWVKMTGMMPPEYHGHYECSRCSWHGKYSFERERDYDYCPHCGAKMDESEESK